MRVLYGIIILAILSLTACSHGEEKSVLTGSLLLKGKVGTHYDEVELTDSYLVLLDRKHDTIIQVYKKNDLSRLHAFALKGYGAHYFSNPEFMKSNTRETAGKDGFWIVDNQLTFNKVQVSADSLRFDRKYISIPGLMPSTHYNITAKETYAVPIVEKDVYGPFCYANPDDGIYWVDPPKEEKAYRLCKPVAYLPSLCVNERQNRVVAALRFFNRVDFYDLAGAPQKSVAYGGKPVAPSLTADGKGVDVLGSTKCFIDIFGTDRYVYCLYDGTVDFSAASTLLVFTWNGKLEKTLRLDRSVRRMAVDASDRFLVALSQGENGVCDVIKYPL